MILDFGLPPAALLAQLDDLKERLHRIASANILDSTLERDQLAQVIIESLREPHFDAIYGGFYRIDRDEYHLSTYQNGVLAEYLLLVDKVIYHGEPRFYALGLLNNLCQFHWVDKAGFFDSGVVYPQHQVPFVISGTQLMQRLEESELNLLAGLLNEATIKPATSYPLHYQVSLKDAARQIGMPFKQAQIFQATIQAKLQMSQAESYTGANQTCQIDLPANCQVLIVLTQAMLRYDAQQFSNTARRLRATLLEYLVPGVVSAGSMADKVLAAEQIDICYALVEHLQFEFDATILRRVSAALTRLNLSSDSNLSPHSTSQLGTLLTIINYFGQGAREDYRVRLETPKLQVASDDQVRIKCFAKDASGLRKKHERLSTFDINLRIFTP
jgi:hypothetical protein